MSDYQVFLTAEALEVFKGQLLDAFIHRAGFPHIDCHSIDPDGQYLHVVSAEPLLGLKLPAVDFLIPHVYILCISSVQKEKSPGFVEYLERGGKGNAEGH